ncbi:HNH endonuclease [Wukongibacter baidiensis]|uniref:HNH endonuclease n=1 Tax=Wukongibacter baidiensis TaxID=1723361 RepID=UPI003D7FD9FB
MKHKKNDKRYIYLRDDGICYFCDKGLKFKQISIDHYLPKSKGGPDDIYNLVCSCKRCNKDKKSTVPDDYKEVMLSLFKKAVQDGKITSTGIKEKDLIDLTDNVYKIEEIGEYTVFQSNTHRFYIKNNKIHKIIRVETKKTNEEW